MNPGTGGALLSVAIENEGVLHAAYMPFIEGGGLFIPATGDYRLGDEVFVLLRLFDHVDGIPLAGKVVWIAPAGTRGGVPAGIGVQFNDRDDMVRRRIEDSLANADPALRERPTYTL